MTAHARLVPLAVATALGVVAVAHAANPGSSATPSGQTLNVRIDVPANGASVPAAPLTVSGVAGIGALAGAGATNLMYIADNSGSTGSTVGDCNGDGAANAGDDANGDGVPGDVLDCEVASIVALNHSLAGSGVNAGVVAFGSMADTGDVAPAAGQQDFAATNADTDGNGTADLEDVARSVTRAGIGRYTAYTTSGGGTDFNNAIGAANRAFAAKAGQRNIAAFISDGASTVDTAAGAALDAARAAGTRINTFSVGASAQGCQTGSALRTIADTTGGTCTEVKDPTKLTASLSGAGAGLSSVAVSANGGAAVAATVNALGGFTAQLPAAALRSGTNTIRAAAVATDGTTATADVQVTVGGRLTASSVIGLPSAKRCTSKRLFPIRIRQVAGARYDVATIFVNRKRVRVYTRYRRRWVRVGKVTAKYLKVKTFTGYVDLRGLAKGRYTVRIVVVTTTGRVVTGTRKYRTCTRKLKGSVPRL